MHASGGGTATISAGGTITARGFPSGAGSIESAQGVAYDRINGRGIDRLRGQGLRRQ